MSATAALQATWSETLVAADLTDPDGLSWTELVTLYGGPGRLYHNLAHVAACLAHLAGTDHDRPPLRLALFYHDAIYDTRREDNEEASARLAEKRLTQMGAPDQLIRTVAALILATTHEAATEDAERGLLCDIDLATLGGPEPEYQAYAEAIRREYAWVPEADYRTGRSRVLRSFLARDRIYQTGPFHHLEAAARRNLAHELAKLASP